MRESRFDEAYYDPLDQSVALAAAISVILNRARARVRHSAFRQWLLVAAKEPFQRYSLTPGGQSRRHQKPRARRKDVVLELLLAKAAETVLLCFEGWVSVARKGQSRRALWRFCQEFYLRSLGLRVLSGLHSLCKERRTARELASAVLQDVADQCLATKLVAAVDIWRKSASSWAQHQRILGLLLQRRSTALLNQCQHGWRSMAVRQRQIDTVVEEEDCKRTLEQLLTLLYAWHDIAWSSSRTAAVQQVSRFYLGRAILKGWRARLDLTRRARVACSSAQKYRAWHHLAEWFELSQAAAQHRMCLCSRFLAAWRWAVLAGVAERSVQFSSQQRLLRLVFGGFRRCVAMGQCAANVTSLRSQSRCQHAVSDWAMLWSSRLLQRKRRLAKVIGVWRTAVCRSNACRALSLRHRQEVLSMPFRQLVAYRAWRQQKREIAMQDSLRLEEKIAELRQRRVMATWRIAVCKSSSAAAFQQEACNDEQHEVPTPSQQVPVIHCASSSTALPQRPSSATFGSQPLTRSAPLRHTSVTSGRGTARALRTSTQAASLAACVGHTRATCYENGFSTPRLGADGDESEMSSVGWLWITGGSTTAAIEAGDGCGFAGEASTFSSPSPTSLAGKRRSLPATAISASPRTAYERISAVPTTAWLPALECPNVSDDACHPSLSLPGVQPAAEVLASSSIIDCDSVHTTLLQSALRKWHGVVLNSEVCSLRWWMWSVWLLRHRRIEIWLKWRAFSCWLGSRLPAAAAQQRAAESHPEVEWSAEPIPMQQSSRRRWHRRGTAVQRQPHSPSASQMLAIFLAWASLSERVGIMRTALDGPSRCEVDFLLGVFSAWLVQTLKNFKVRLLAKGNGK